LKHPRILRKRRWQTAFPLDEFGPAPLVDAGWACPARSLMRFAAGVDADGIRYRLGYPFSLETTFTGTIWDWLTASD
jgi:hypothetical protein